MNIFLFMWICILFETAFVTSCSVENSCQKRVKSQGKKIFKYYPEQYTMMEATMSCLSKCGELAVIESPEEQAAAIAAIYNIKLYVWIGLIWDGYNSLFWQKNSLGVAKSSLPYHNIHTIDYYPFNANQQQGAVVWKGTINGEVNKWYASEYHTKYSYLCQFYKEKRRKKQAKRGKHEKCKELGNKDNVKVKERTVKGPSEFNFWSPMFFIPNLYPKD